MNALLPALLAAAAVFDGQAALRHASALAALGPHPWGSPRALAAAQYVAVQLRDAGLADVRLQDFDTGGIHGINVVGRLPGPGAEFVVIGAHHDSAPGAPGAYDDGGGVGVVIEAARVLARRSRSRALVFVTWDGEEAWSTGHATTTGSRAFIKQLGANVRDMVVAVDVEMCGWKGGTPAIHPVPYADPLRPGRYHVVPAWAVAAALRGARSAGAPLTVGDPRLSWLYQPAVRTLRVKYYGDDLSFVEAGLPALFLSDSSFTAFYPWYHQPTDTPDRIEAPALARMGQAVLGIVDELSRVKRGPATEAQWFAAFGHAFSWPILVALALLSVIPGLAHASSQRDGAFGLRLFQAALFGVVFWRHPVPALWIFMLPNVVGGLPRKRGGVAIAVLPLLALVVLGIVAWLRGFASGLWIAGWELAIAALAFALVWAAPPRR
ncbi:MAG TPA: M28 family metallopeptidase [Vicinamibacteria bacterium]|nr:M28 family metallopeptidase [Vicinamibacteria bacterium]